jgi:hypothetical protein
MLRTLLYIIKLFTTHRSFQKNNELRDTSPCASRFFSTHDKRKLLALKTEMRKGTPSYSKILLLKAYKLLQLTKEKDLFSLKNELDNLIRMLIDWRCRLDGVKEENKLSKDIDEANEQQVENELEENSDD